MYHLHEALARERIRERQQRSQRSQLSAELAAASRWHYVAARAGAVAMRHTRRAEQAADAER